MSAIEMLTRGELTLYRSYHRKNKAGRASEITTEERAAATKHNKFVNQLNPLRARYTCKKASAKRNNTEFSLTFDKYVQLANSTPICPLLGIPLDYSAGHGKGLQECTASIDRIDPTKGYTNDNCWIISHKANRMKNSATVDELKQLVEALERLSNVSQV